MATIIGYKKPTPIIIVNTQRLRIKRRVKTPIRVRPKQIRIPMANRQVLKFEELPEHVQSIILAVKHYTGIDEQLILGKNRKREIVISRQMAMHFCLEYITESESKIGRWFNRDHSVAYNSDYRIKAYRDTDKKFLRLYQTIKADFDIRFKDVIKCQSEYNKVGL